MYKLFASFFVYIIFQTLSFAQNNTIVYEQENEFKSIGNSIFYLEDTTSQFISAPNGIISQNDRFIKNNGEVLNFANTQSAFWFRFEIQKNIEDDMYLEIHNPMLDSLLLFEQIGNELKQIDVSGAAFPLSYRKINYTLPNFLLPIQNGETKQFYLYTKSNFPTQTSLSVGTSKSLFENQHPYDVAIGIYIGIMLVMALYNLFIFISIKDKMYLYYVLYVFFIALLYVDFKGYSFEYLWSKKPVLNFYIPVLASFVVTFVLLFSRLFLETKKNAPKLDKIFFFLIGLCMISITTGLFNLYNISAITGQLAVILMAFYLIGTSTYLLIKGYKPARLFLLAWFAYLVGLIVFILQLNAAIPNTWFTDNSVLFGSAIEVVLLSFALADRINVYKREKEEAQEEALEKTKAHDKLITEQNILLGAKVKEATEELRVSNEELNSTNEELNAMLETVQQQKDTIEERSAEIESINEEIKATNEELNSTNEELYSTVETVKKQSRIIEDANRSITDSLRYAQTIQDAILPFEERMDSHLKEYFTFYRPKDIVSGDFYWLTDLKGKIYLAVADCTGHGVPGAFMSMIGSAALDALVDRNELEAPDEILAELHLTIQKALKQKNSTNDDGMDVGLCVLKYLPNGHCKVLYSGAKRPLYYYKKSSKELIEVRGTRQSIGGYSKKERKPFEVNEIIMEQGDCFYLCSDGYADQNDANDNKFGSHHLKKLINDIIELPMKEQGAIIRQKFDEHKGTEAQRDDIAMIGVRIS